MTDDQRSPPRPGPDLLEEEPPTPPQLDPTEEWQADPLLLSGRAAYDDGEYVYQDYVFDDHGASTREPAVSWSRDPQQQPRGAAAGPPTGDLVYPTDVETYGHDAADLLEFRARPVDGGVAYRITLQTMTVPDAAAVAIGIDTGGDPGTDDWGYGIGELGDLSLDHVLVTWGTGAELDGERLADDRVSVDVERNRIEVTVPLDPGEETWRHYAVVGLWDAEDGRFVPIRDEPTRDQPGGGNGTSPPPVFNVAFRFDEPLEAFGLDESEVTPPTPLGRGYYREHAQATALAERDISALGTDVDFGKLSAGVVERPSPTAAGYHNRLYTSRFDLGEGIDLAFPENGPTTTRGYGRFLNRVQPYSLYVPDGYDPDREHPLVLYLHGGGGTYNDVGLLPGLLRQLGDERDALVLAVEGRGPRLLYEDAGELDVFEALSDVLTRYNVDRDRIAVGGFSMGGYGAFSLATKYPDCFAGVFSVSDGGIGINSEFEATLANLRHLPVKLVNGFRDSLSDEEVFLGTVRALRDLGYRHEVDAFLEWSHFSPLLTDDWWRVRDFLDGGGVGAETVTTSPARVTYRRLPGADSPQYGLVHDGAYWVQDVRVSNLWNEGLVDVHEKSSGTAPSTPETYGDFGTDPADYITLGTRWNSEPDRPARNELAVDLEHVTRVTLYVDATDLDPTRPIRIDVRSTDAAELRLRSHAGDRTVSVPSGTTTHEVSLSDGE